MKPRYFLLPLLSLGLATPAWAQAPQKLAVHGWITGTFDSATLHPEGQVGIAIPFSRVSALAIEGQGSNTSAGLNVGPTFEIGALYIAPMASFQSSYAGKMSFGGQFLAAFEAPPLPLYLETKVRGLYGMDGGESGLSDRTLLMITLPWFAVGAEHDGLNPFNDAVGYNRWGPRFSFGFGKSVVLGIYAGFELDKEAREQALMEPHWLTGQATLTVKW